MEHPRWLLPSELTNRPGSRTPEGPAAGQNGHVIKRLLIVDDDARFRGLLRMLLEDVPEFEVVGDAQDGGTALKAARDLSPDVVLLDVNLPDTTGFELAPQLVAQGGDPEVVLISSRGDESYHELAEQAGATAFLPKDELSPEAIRRVLS